jgi:hypothetical protein
MKFEFDSEIKRLEGKIKWSVVYFPGLDLIDAPSKEWLEANGTVDTVAELLKAVEQADKECGSCGCESFSLLTIIVLDVDGGFNDYYKDNLLRNLLYNI